MDCGWKKLVIITLCAVFNVSSQNMMTVPENPVDYLSHLKQEGPLIKINSTTFDILSNGGDFQYKLIVLFTTLNSNRGCSVCIPVFHEFMSVVQSFENDGRKDTYPFQLFFALVDFDESPSIFRKLKIVTAPLLLHLSGLRMRAGSFDKFDIKTNDVTASEIALWISDRTGVQIIVSPHPSTVYAYGVLLGFTVSCVSILLTFLGQMYIQLRTKRDSPAERPVLKPVYRKRSRGESFPRQKLDVDKQEVEVGRPRESSCRHKRSRQRMTCNF